MTLPTDFQQHISHDTMECACSDSDQDFSS